jgi:hypothetical protein
LAEPPRNRAIPEKRFDMFAEVEWDEEMSLFREKGGDVE